ncbi:hypothetical protein TGDOM2_288420 [Toxoplasma gondii GAB2-2007-GAL-DOM2]|uniref:Uncharacterized protein n=5 Tax=Toxoplasma gondii TaxID=5811 RepID=S7UQH7_TOXGG|nr:hypothetical protein TGGT1_288420 [Toxoplasma gondii GT1]KAF4644335.1 hypothetical protein TGRH88_013280 [Toxoplasma gondii]KFG42868.1 hypothetical protein TGDOM2_288420 [Toxoplasma gondii GAB2-2007-GAL-DOM2]KFG53195.1 hypothetical protein TGFOU_288420 [Toxoplasma gondii FOU]RQX73870.1 hypothetical protein TGCAST_288420 [Toxoplasma gondii CAST]
MPRASLRNRRKNGSLHPSASSSPEGEERVSPSPSLLLYSSSSDTSSSSSQVSPFPAPSGVAVQTSGPQRQAHEGEPRLPALPESCRSPKLLSNFLSLSSSSCLSSSSSFASSAPSHPQPKSENALPLQTDDDGGSASVSGENTCTLSLFASPVGAAMQEPSPSLLRSPSRGQRQEIPKGDSKPAPSLETRGFGAVRLLSPALSAPASLGSRTRDGQQVEGRSRGEGEDGGESRVRGQANSEKRAQGSPPSSPVLCPAFSSPVPFQTDGCLAASSVPSFFSFSSSLRFKERQGTGPASDNFTGQEDRVFFSSSCSSSASSASLVPLCSRYRTPKSLVEEERETGHGSGPCLSSFAFSPQRREREFVSSLHLRASESLSRKRLAFSSPESVASAAPVCSSLGREEKRNFLSPVLAPRPFERHTDENMETEERMETKERMEESQANKERKEKKESTWMGARNKEVQAKSSNTMSPLLFYSEPKRKEGVEGKQSQGQRSLQGKVNVEPSVEMTLQVHERGRSLCSRGNVSSLQRGRGGEKERETKAPTQREHRTADKEREAREKTDHKTGREREELQEHRQRRETGEKGTPKKRKPRATAPSREERKAFLKERRLGGAFACTRESSREKGERISSTSVTENAKDASANEEADCVEAVTDLWERGLLSPKAPRDRSLGYGSSHSSPRKSVPLSLKETRVETTQAQTDSRQAAPGAAEISGQGDRCEEQKEREGEEEEKGVEREERGGRDDGRRKEEIYIDPQALKWMAPFCADEDQVLTRARRRRNSVTVFHHLHEQTKGLASRAGPLSLSDASRPRRRCTRSRSRSLSVERPEEAATGEERAGRGEKQSREAETEREKEGPARKTDEKRRNETRAEEGERCEDGRAAELGLKEGKESRRLSSCLQVDEGGRPSRRRGPFLQVEEGKRSEKSRDHEKRDAEPVFQSRVSSMTHRRASSVSSFCDIASPRDSSKSRVEASKPRVSESRVALSPSSSGWSLSPRKPAFCSPLCSPARRGRASFSDSAALAFPLSSVSSLGSSLSRASPPRVSGSWSLPLAEVMSPSSPPRSSTALRPQCPVLSPAPSLASSSPHSASRQTENAGKTLELDTSSTLLVRRSPRLFAASLGSLQSSSLSSGSPSLCSQGTPHVSCLRGSPLRASCGIVVPSSSKKKEKSEGKKDGEENKQEKKNAEQKKDTDEKKNGEGNREQKSEASPAKEKGRRVTRLPEAEERRMRASPEKDRCLGGPRKAAGKRETRGKEQDSVPREDIQQSSSVSSSASFVSTRSDSLQTDNSDRVSGRASKKLRTRLSPPATLPTSSSSSLSLSSSRLSLSSSSGRRAAPMQQADSLSSAVSLAPQYSQPNSRRQKSDGDSVANSSRLRGTRVRTGADLARKARMETTGKKVEGEKKEEIEQKEEGEMEEETCAKNGRKAFRGRAPACKREAPGSVGKMESRDAKEEKGKTTEDDKNEEVHAKAKAETVTSEASAGSVPSLPSLSASSLSSSSVSSSGDAPSLSLSSLSSLSSSGNAPRASCERHELQGGEDCEGQDCAEPRKEPHAEGGDMASAPSFDESRSSEKKAQVRQVKIGAVGEQSRQEERGDSAPFSAALSSESGRAAASRSAKPSLAKPTSSLGSPFPGTFCFSSPFRRRASSSEASTERQTLLAPLTQLSAARHRLSSSDASDVRSVSGRSSGRSSSSVLPSSRRSSFSAASPCASPSSLAAHADDQGLRNSRTTSQVSEWERRRVEEEAKHERDLQQALDDDLEQQVHCMRQSGASVRDDAQEPSPRDRKRKRESDEAEAESRRADLSMHTPSFLALDPFLVDEADEKLLTTQQLRTYLSTIITGDLREKSREALLYMAKAWSLQTHTSTGVPSSRMNFANVGERFVPQAARRVQGKVLPKERRRHSILRCSSSAVFDGSRENDKPEKLKRRRISFSPFNKVQLYTLDETERQSKEEAAQRSFQNEQQQLLLLERQRESASSFSASFASPPLSASRVDCGASQCPPHGDCAASEQENGEKENRRGDADMQNVLCSPFAGVPHFSTPPPPGEKAPSSDREAGAGAPPFSSVSSEFFVACPGQGCSPRESGEGFPEASLSRPLSALGRSRVPHLTPLAENRTEKQTRGEGSSSFRKRELLSARRGDESPLGSAAFVHSKLPFTTSPSFKLLHGSPEVSRVSVSPSAASSPFASACAPGLRRAPRPELARKQTLSSRPAGGGPVSSLQALRETHLRAQAPSLSVPKPALAPSPFSSLAAVCSRFCLPDKREQSERRRASTFADCTYTGGCEDDEENRENRMANVSLSRAERGREETGKGERLVTEKDTVGNETPVQFYISPSGQRVYRRGSLVSPATVSGFQCF